MVIQKMVDWYKSWGFCGWARFRLLWFAHRFIRNSGLAEQWDFVLKYIPYGNHFGLDIGTYGSLFIYELRKRTCSFGLDLKGYQETAPFVFKIDILYYSPVIKYDFITMISVLQFVDPQQTIKKISSLLQKNGLFLLTVPQDKYNYIQLKKLTEPYFEILEYQPCRGHLGMAFIKK